MFAVTDWVDAQYFDTENEALDFAFDWSVRQHGSIITILLNGIHIKNVWA